MKIERCWICRRTKEELIEEFPEDFWDEKLTCFSQWEFMGKPLIIGTYEDDELPRPTEVNTSILKTKDPLLKVDMIDSKRQDLSMNDYIVGKKGETNICKICAQIIFTEPGEETDWIYFRFRDFIPQTDICIYKNEEFEKLTLKLLKERC